MIELTRTYLFGHIDCISNVHHLLQCFQCILYGNGVHNWNTIDLLFFKQIQQYSDDRGDSPVLISIFSKKIPQKIIFYTCFLFKTFRNVEKCWKQNNAYNILTFNILMIGLTSDTTFKVYICHYPNLTFNSKINCFNEVLSYVKYKDLSIVIIILYFYVFVCAVLKSN